MNREKASDRINRIDRIFFSLSGRKGETAPAFGEIACWIGIQDLFSKQVPAAQRIRVFNSIRELETKRDPVNPVNPVKKQRISVRKQDDR